MRINKHTLTKTTAIVLALSLLTPSYSSALEQKRTDNNKDTWVLEKEEITTTSTLEPDKVHDTSVYKYEYNDKGEISYESVTFSGTCFINESSYTQDFEDFGSIKYDSKGYPSEVILNTSSSNNAKQENKYTYKNNLLQSSVSVYTTAASKIETKKSYTQDEANTIIYTSNESTCKTDLKTKEETTKYYYSEFKLNSDQINYSIFKYAADSSYKPLSNSYVKSTTPVTEFRPRKVDINCIHSYQVYPKLTLTASKENVVEYNENKQVSKLIQYTKDGAAFIYDNWQYDSNNNPIKCDYSIARYDQRATTFHPGYVDYVGNIQFTWKKFEMKSSSSDTPKDDTSGGSSNNGGSTYGGGSTTTKPGKEYTQNNATYQVTQNTTTKDEIGEIAFIRPTKQTTKVTVPATVKINNKTYKVTAIDAAAFQNNTKLKSITIGKNVKKIGKNAFKGCKNLKTIKIKTTKLTKKNVGKNAFSGIHKKAKATVPKTKLKTYKKMLKARGMKKKTQKIVSASN